MFENHKKCLILYGTELKIILQKDIRRIVNCQSNVGNPLCDIFPDIFKHFVFAFVNAVFLV